MVIMLILVGSQEVAQTPTVSILPANSSISFNGTYTLVMVDADVVGSKLPNGQTRHWLENGVTIEGMFSQINTCCLSIHVCGYTVPFRSIRQAL